MKIGVKADSPSSRTSVLYGLNLSTTSSASVRVEPDVIQKSLSSITNGTSVSDQAIFEVMSLIDSTNMQKKKGVRPQIINIGD